jgi:hypothetical protein
MTTIVWKRPWLASDSFSTADKAVIVEHNTKKIWSTKGLAVAVSGRYSYASMLAEFVIKNDTSFRKGVVPKKVLTIREKKKDVAEVLIVTATKAWIMDFDFVLEPCAGDTTLGSGWIAALGALHNGADAMQAVAAACKVDCFSGGDIQSVNIEEL